MIHLKDNIYFAINDEQVDYTKFEKIGECDKDEVTFDCEPYVESFILKEDGITEGKFYKNYLDNEKVFYNKTKGKKTGKENSFRSKIESLTGKKWVNPIPKPTEYKFNSPYLNNYYTEQNKLWQEAENKLLKKVVILKQVK